MTRLLLGSASRGRLGVLRQAGVEPLVVVSGVDEDAIIATLGDAPPTAIVGALAAAKADDIVGRLPDGVDADCVVIGCDSMLYLDGQLCGKPGTVDGARRQWRAMSGRTGELHTGHALIAVRNRSVVHRAVESAVTTVHFASPSDADREAYLDSGEPLGVAGGFTLDGLGGWFIDRIDGDPSNVIGLSLPLVRRMLTSAGVSISEVWASNRSD